MTGIITQWKGTLNCGFINGEDGKEYFLHGSESASGKANFKKTNIVKFDIQSTPNEKRDRAVNVVKIGHGAHHPFMHELENLANVIKECDIDEELKGYKLRDIEMLENYFLNICDIEQFADVRHTFRPKWGKENGTT